MNSNRALDFVQLVLQVVVTTDWVNYDSLKIHGFVVVRDLSDQLLFSSSNIFSIQSCHSKKWRSDPQPEIEDSSKPSSKFPLPFDSLLNLSSTVLEANTVRSYARCDFDRLMHGVNT